MSEGNQQPNLVEVRRCKKCGETKSITEFPRCASKKGKLYKRHACTPCNQARYEAWRQKHYETWGEKIREYARTTSKARYHIFRRAVVAAYGGKCKCCGERNYAFLAIDHKERNGRKARGVLHPTTGVPFMLWIIEHGFPDMLQILCHNCNMAREFNNGICPHQEGSEAIPSGSTSEVSRSADGSTLQPFPAYRRKRRTRKWADDMVRSLQ